MKSTLIKAFTLLFAIALAFGLLSVTAFADEQTDTRVCGDIYADGEVNVKDAIFLLQYIAKSATIADDELKYANLFVEDNGADGAVKVNIKDAIILLQALAKMNVTLGAGEWKTTAIPTPETAGEVWRNVYYGVERASLPPLNPNFYTATETLAPTCYSAGEVKYSCTVNGGTFEFKQSVPMLTDHTVVIDEAVKATCLAEGLTEGSHCKWCLTVLKPQETLQKLPHTLVTIHAEEATCLKDGHGTGEKCSTCGTVTVQPEIYPMIPHTEVTGGAKDATCTEAGFTGETKCSVCQTVTKPGTVIAALGHTFVKGKCECGAEDPDYVPEPIRSALTYVDVESGEHSNPAEYTEGTALTLLDAERRGYTFLGWYNSNNEKISEISSSATGDITLTAKWELATYTITYENTKTVDISSYVKTYTMLDDDILLPTISLDGYTFGGWEIDGQRVTSIKSGSVGNIVVKAILIPPQYTLLLETPYGKLESKTVTVGYGEHYTLPVISYEGKTFLGWYDNTGDSGVQYTDGSGNSVAPYPHTSGRMLYARFEALSCIVSYDTMGGDPITSAYVDYGSAFDDSVIPTKENAIFAGWYNSDFSSRYTSGSVISSDITVYSKWIESTPISTAEELIAIRNNPSGNYHLTCDINMNGTVWTPIDTFSGTLDGKGFRIKNFTIHPSSYITPYGFIRTNKGTVQNLIFTDFTFNISMSNQSGAVFGVIVGLNNGNIYNCLLETGAISVTFTLHCPEKAGSRIWFGGICGQNSGKVVGCQNKVSMTFSLTHTSNNGGDWDDYEGVGSFGGIVGYNGGKLTSCYYEGTLNYSSHINCPKWMDGKKRGIVGGIVGQNVSSGTVTDCFTNVTITASTSNTENDNNHYLYMGGVVGQNYGKITGSYATGSIQGKNAKNIDIGGVVGYSDGAGNISNCYAKVDCKSTSNGTVGGFIGYNNATVQNCYSTGSVNGAVCAGGFVGWTGTGSTISKCYSSGNVTSTASNSGFFIGGNAGILYNCYFMRGATLLLNGQYKDYMIEQNVVEGISYSTIWSKEFLVDTLYWDSEGWIILANEDPILEWEISVDHNYNKTIIEPTCTDFGFTIYNCTDCDRYFITDVVSEHGHDITHSTVVAPTCTERGYTASYCSRCDDTVVTEVVEALGHTRGELVEHHAPTCTEDGYDIYSCTVCSVKEAITVVLEATGHTEVVVPAVEQTCTEQGKTERIYCSVCKTPIKTSKPIEPHFYHPDTTTILKAATCTEAGECTRYCVVCEHLEENVAIAPTGHTDLNGDILCDTCGAICGEYADEVVTEISTAEQLAAIADNLNGVYRLMANITLPYDWKPIGSEDAPFTGFLDGNGYKITLCSFENMDVAGLFGYNDGVIRGINITNAILNVRNMDAVFGGIAAYNSGLITGCSLTGDATLYVETSNTSSAAEISRVIRSVIFGGLVGSNEIAGKISDCSTNVNLKVRLTNSAICTASRPLLWKIWTDKTYKNILVESIAVLTVGCIVGNNGGDVTACSSTGTTQLGDPNGYNKQPSASSEHYYGVASAYNNYYYGDIAGISNGTVSDCTEKASTEWNVNDMDVYVTVDSGWYFTEKVRSEVHLTFFIS